MISKRWKKLIFRRGYMPDGDSHDMFDRVRERADETYEPLKRLVPPLQPTLLANDISPAEREKYEASRKETNDALLKESQQRFMKVVTEEAEAQWDRILDRRAKDWFYSGFVGLLFGYVLGKFL